MSRGNAKIDRFKTGKIAVTISVHQDVYATWTHARGQRRLSLSWLAEQALRIYFKMPAAVEESEIKTHAD